MRTQLGIQFLVMGFWSLGRVGPAALIKVWGWGLGQAFLPDADLIDDVTQIFDPIWEEKSGSSTTKTIVLVSGLSTLLYQKPVSFNTKASVFIGNA